MAILMGAAMAVVMLSFMWSMYSHKAVNIGIYVVSALVFALSLWLVRSQATVGEVSYMRAMIPHHSIAIMTSERAQIRDPRTQKLAHEIIAAQRKEIAEMRYLIAQISAGETVEQIYQDPPAEPGSVEDALANTLLSTLDLAPLPEAEAAKVLDAVQQCRFNTSPETDPILWTDTDGGVGAVKLNGVIIALKSGGAEGAFTTSGMDLSVLRLSENEVDWRADAALTFTLEDGPTAGYRGFLTCDT